MTCTNNRNIKFCTLGPLVWGKATIPQSIQTGKATLPQSIQTCKATIPQSIQTFSANDHCV